MHKNYGKKASFASSKMSAAHSGYSSAMAKPLSQITSKGILPKPPSMAFASGPKPTNYNLHNSASTRSLKQPMYKKKSRLNFTPCFWKVWEKER